MQFLRCIDVNDMVTYRTKTTAIRGMESDMRALIVGSSGGIGGALCERLKRDGRFDTVVGLSRRDDGIDLLDEETIRQAAGRLAESHTAFDLIVNATGVLTINGQMPEKSIKAIDANVMAAQFAINSIGPALLLKHLHLLLPEDRRSVFASISARVGSIGDNRLGGWISYRASKAAANQIIKTAAIEISRLRPRAIVVVLHPGTVETDLSKPFLKGHTVMSPDTAAGKLISTVFGLTLEQSGGFFAYDGSAIEW